MPPNKLEEEVRILREAVKRFEEMDIPDDDQVNRNALPSTAAYIDGSNTAHGRWRYQRNTISAWVKEQLGEV